MATSLLTQLCLSSELMASSAVLIGPKPCSGVYVREHACAQVCPTRLCPYVSVRVSSPLTSSSFLLCRGHCSPDRSYALAGSWDGALYIWDVDTGKLESSLRGPHW